MKKLCVICSVSFEARGYTLTCSPDCRLKRKNETKRACNRTYQAANRELVNQQARVYREAHREQENARMRAYYEANRKRELERRHAYREANLERERERDRAYSAANRARHTEYNRARRERIRENRRAAKKGSEAFI